MHLRLSALVLAGVVLAAGCGPNDAPPDTDSAADTTVTDALGRSVTLPNPPRRLLALAPNLTELVVAVGAGDRLVGRSQSDTYPEAVLDLPMFSTFPLEPEGVVALSGPRRCQVSPVVADDAATDAERTPGTAGRTSACSAAPGAPVPCVTLPVCKDRPWPAVLAPMSRRPSRRRAVPGRPGSRIPRPASRPRSSLRTAGGWRRTMPRAAT